MPDSNSSFLDTLLVPFEDDAFLGRRAGVMAPILDRNFPDPCVVEDDNGKWMAFATSGGGKNIQMARPFNADPLGPWELVNVDALPDKGWTTGRNYWAPDVRRFAPDKYVMYFSGENPQGRHCIGIAWAGKIDGPYKMRDGGPVICPWDQGGAIDPAGFRDHDGKRYVVYKIDGGALPGGTNGKNKTPLMLQEVDRENGSRLIGAPVELLDHVDGDGGLVEAPNLVRLPGGGYVLFYSSHMYVDEKYDIKYAVSKSLKGPYVRASKPFLKTPDFGLRGPGGATSDEEGTFVVLHGWCHENGQGKRRCMYGVHWRAA